MRPLMTLTLALTAATAIILAAPTPSATAAPAATAQPITLKYKWDEQQPLLYRIIQQTKAQMSGMPGQEQMTVSQSQTMRVRMNVTDVNDEGVATINASLEAVQFQMDPPAGEAITYDSEAADDTGGEPEHPAARAMAAFVGESFTFEVAPDGDVRNVQGMDEILQKIAEAAADPAMQEMFRGKFGDDSMESMLEQAFRMLPAEEVEPGDTWETSVEQTVPTLGTLNMQSTMTLDRVQPENGRQLARIPITMTTTLDRTDTEDAGLPPGTTLTMEDSTGKGVLLFDIDRGQIHSMEMVSQLPMRMSMQMGEEKMEIKQDITSTLKMERLEAGDTTPAPAPAPAPEEDDEAEPDSE